MATPKTTTDDRLTFHLGGKSYVIDDFTIGELEWLETEMGCRLEDIEYGSMKALVRIVYLIKHRDNDDYSLDDARKEKLNLFSEEEGADDPPTTARQGRANGRPTSPKSSASKNGK